MVSVVEGAYVHMYIYTHIYVDIHIYIYMYTYMYVYIVLPGLRVCETRPCWTLVKGFGPFFYMLLASR